MESRNWRTKEKKYHGPEHQSIVIRWCLEIWTIAQILINTSNCRIVEWPSLSGYLQITYSKRVWFCVENAMVWRTLAHTIYCWMSTYPCRRLNANTIDNKQNNSNNNNKKKHCTDVSTISHKTPAIPGIICKNSRYRNVPPSILGEVCHTAKRTLGLIKSLHNVFLIKLRKRLQSWQFNYF